MTFNKSLRHVPATRNYDPNSQREICLTHSRVEIRNQGLKKKPGPSRKGESVDQRIIHYCVFSSGFMISLHMAAQWLNYIRKIIRYYYRSIYSLVAWLRI